MPVDVKAAENENQKAENLFKSRHSCHGRQTGDGPEASNVTSTAVKVSVAGPRARSVLGERCVQAGRSFQTQGLKESYFYIWERRKSHFLTVRNMRNIRIYVARFSHDGDK